MSSNSWDYSLFWKEVLNQIRASVSDQEWMMWFKNIAYEKSAELLIQVAVPSSFYRDQVRQRYGSLIEEKLHELSGSPLEIEYLVVSPSAPEEKTSEQKEEKTGKKTKHKEPAKKRMQNPSLRAEYVFENFVIGDNNSFAANAAYAISKNPGTAYNPCLIYGGVGLGKTHLIQAIGNAAHANFETSKVVYVTAETFTNEFIQAIRDKNNHKFKNKYRNVDVLLIDDIHFLQNKDQTQEELFHTFNALYDANKQMVFTCDRPVSELKQLTDRLRSRFERGLNVDLQPPNFETRAAILKQKIDKQHIVISDDVIELISKNITTNVRDLEAALTKLLAYGDLVNKDITLDIAQRQLRDIFSNPKQSNINIDIIQRTVAEYFGQSHIDLRGKKRTKAIVFPRQLAMYIIRQITEYSTTEVGLEFGGRDHTTVMHACQRIESRMKADPTLEPIIQQLVRNIKEQSSR